MSFSFRTELGILALFILSCSLFPRLTGAQTTYRIPQDVSTIQAAIDKAQDGDTVLVSPGSYAVNLDFEGKAITVTSGATNYTSPAALATTLTPLDPTQPVVYFIKGEGLKSVLNGFTITDGNSILRFGNNSFEGSVFSANTFAPYPQLSSTATIMNNRFVGNVVPLEASGEVSHNYFTQNSGFGGTIGVSGYFHDNLIENNIIQGSLLDGGGRVERNVIRNNQVADPQTCGADCRLISIQGAFSQNLVYGNSAYILVLSPGGFGGPLGLNSVIAENTFANNGVPSSCTSNCSMTQLYLWKHNSFEGNGALIANNIFQSNSPGPYISCPDDNLGPYPPFRMDTLQVDHNLFSVTAAPLYDANCRPQITNTGNVTADPKFANPAAGDFHLTAGSPAVDTGNNSLIAQLAGFGVSLATDFDGYPRPVDATGLGYPVLDMGVYELPGVADGAPTSLLLTPSSYAPNITQTINFTAQLSSALGIPVGTVTFLENGKAVATAPVLSNGTATVALPLNTQGIAEFLATYPGAYPFTPASSTKLVLEVALFPTYITLTASPLAAVAGQPVTLSVMTGSTDKTVPSPITLTANRVALGTVLPDANGNASLTVTTLQPGTDTIVAAYAGDQHHGPSSATATVTVTLNDFGLALNPPSVTVKAGLSGQVNVLLSSLGLFAGSLHLNAGNLPQYASATFVPGSVALSAGSSAPATLTIDTSAAVRAFLGPGPSRDSTTLSVAFGVLLLAPCALRRRARLAALGFLLLPFLGCTDIHLPLAKVAPGTYTIPISAADPVTGIIHSANLTLIVTP